MRRRLLVICVCLTLPVGCALTPAPQLRYEQTVDPVLPAGGAFYVDPMDSSVVWSEEGLQIKVRHYTDQMLDAEFDPRISPYTLTGWEPISAFSEYTHAPLPLYTVFRVTVINRTRERVELDPTQVVLRLPGGRKLYCRQGVGVYVQYPEYVDYSYLKWGGRDGNTHYTAAYDRNDLWTRTQYLREKPVRQGRRYTGLLTFPPLPPDVTSFTLEINDFILAFDRDQVGYGNPVEFMDIAFGFDVEHGYVEVGGSE